LPPARSTESTGAEGEQGAGATADEVVRVEDDGAFVWKVASSAVRRTWPSSAEGGPIELRHGSGNAVTACVVVFGGRAVLTATHGGEMTLWALPSGVELCTVHAHLRRVSHCAVWESAASGGKKPRHRVLSSSQDGTAVVWDLSLSQSELARAISEQRGVGGAALAPRYSLEDDDDDDASSATATAVGPVDSAETEELRRAVRSTPVALPPPFMFR
jgi:WD40 repeat protein